MLRNSILRTLTALLLAFVGSLLADNKTLYGAEFFCPSGDVTCLIAAINEANSTPPEEDTINLAAGVYTLVAADNNVEGRNGLPSITSNITINGAGADVTIIERDPNLDLPVPSPFSQRFRILHVSAEGSLSVNKITLRRGNSIVGPIEQLPSFDHSGGAIANHGTLTINNSVISNNAARHGGGIGNFEGTVTITSSIISGGSAGGIGGDGGGIFSSSGTVTITDSTVSKNSVTEAEGGGIANRAGTMSITNSTISDNEGFFAYGAGISNSGNGTMTIINSTVSGNRLENAVFDGAGISNFGTMTIISSTVSGNRARGSSGGIFNPTGSLELENTILALNTVERPGFPSPISIPSRLQRDSHLVRQ